jgi:precorrin-3B C17-methyltransferase / cobalt-factor III methyltransferase
MSRVEAGSLRVLGLGPGPSRYLTEETRLSLERAEHIVGYQTYLARLPELEGKVLHGSDNGDELARARHGLDLALAGSHVAIVSGGDPGVFGMAAAVFEAIEAGPPAYRSLDVGVLPGVTAMLAAAARLGAPLGNDFCAINLSNNLKPWSVIEQRLVLAARADFVIALYNPASRARPEQIHAAFALLREHRSERAPVAFATAVGRPDEDLLVTTLGRADPGRADMRTLVVVGTASTRVIERAAGSAWLYTPRHIDEAP